MSVLQYDDNLEKLLKDEAEKSESLSILHRMSHEKFGWWSNVINIPIILGSAAVGFTTGVDTGASNGNIWLGAASVVIGCIKSLDSYFQLSRRSETHRIVSLQYAQVNKKIAVELALNREDRVSAKDMLQIIKMDIKNLEELAPLIPDDVIKAFNTRFGSDVHCKKPNITNGLTPIEINKPDIVVKADLGFEVSSLPQKPDNHVLTDIRSNEDFVTLNVENGVELM